MDARDSLIALVERYGGDWDKVYNAIQNKEDISGDGEKLRDDLCNRCNSAGIQIVTIIDNNYPEALKGVNKPPFAIFYRGDLSLLQNKNEKVCVLGNGETISDFGKRVAIKVALDIVKSGTHTLVTSDASAAEIIAQKATRAQKLGVAKTVMCASTALDNVGTYRLMFDSIILSGGLVLSSVPTGHTIIVDARPQSVELGTGNIIVVELGLKKAADFMAELGLTGLHGWDKKYYSVVHDITDEYIDECNELILNHGFLPYLVGSAPKDTMLQQLFKDKK